MSVLDLRRRFRNGELTRHQYIDGMYAAHQDLFGYAALLDGTDIAEITVADREVRFRTREDGLVFAADRADKRIAPIEILNFGRYEPGDREVLLSCARPGGVAIDVGANIGYYALSLAKRMPGGVVHAFEPVPAVFADLERNVRLNAVDNVRTWRMGLGDAAGDLVFQVDPDYCTRTSMGGLGDPSLPTITCPVVRLDDFVQNAGIARVDLIKADVEGAELLVIRGGIETIRRDKPAIFLEMLRKWSARFDYHPNDIIALLAGLGYRCQAVTDGGLRPFSLMDDATVETNFLFLVPPPPPSVGEGRGGGLTG